VCPVDNESTTLKLERLGERAVGVSVSVPLPGRYQHRAERIAVGIAVWRAPPGQRRSAHLVVLLAVVARHGETTVHWCRTRRIVVRPIVLWRR